MASNRESRPLDFLYDPTYILTSKERSKAEKNAQNLMQIKQQRKFSNPLQSSSNLKDVLTIQKIPSDHYSIDKPSTLRDPDTTPQSIIVQSRQKPSYFRGINRFKFHAAPIASDSTKFFALTGGNFSAPVEKSEEDRLMLSDSSGYESNNINKQGASKKIDEQKINQIVDRLYYGYPKKKKSRRNGNRSAECTLEDDYSKYARRPLSKSSSLSSSLPNVKNGANRNSGSPKFDDLKAWTSGDEMSLQKSPNLGQNPLNFSLNSRVTSRSDEKLRSHSTKRSTSRSEKNDRIEALREKLIFQSDCLRKYLDAKLKQLKIRHELDLRNIEKSSPFSSPFVGPKNHHRSFANRRIAKYFTDQKFIPNGHLPIGDGNVENPNIKDGYFLSTKNETSSATVENENSLGEKTDNKALDREDEEKIHEICDEQSILDKINGGIALECHTMQNDSGPVKNDAELIKDVEDSDAVAQKEDQELSAGPFREKRLERITPQWTIKSYVDELIEESMNAVIKYQTCEKIAKILMKEER